MEILKRKAGLLIQLWSILSCLPKRKVNTSTNMSLVKKSGLGILFHTCPFFDDELRTIKRSTRKFEKTYRKNGNSQERSRFINSVVEYFELFTKKKSEYLNKYVASEKKAG